ncbi:DUF1365 domain-containing protein [Pikeienuella sp. HZG-20]|uniref:DUF1365 domain-containing protein n=1 Tax=Paludibacillus litoralis TaxID=3133267 RepID=UPI0030EEB1EB
MKEAETNPEHCLYVGDVMHMRLRPFRHQFRYRVFTALLDIDRLASAERRLFKVDRFGLFSFHRRDHGARDGSALRPWVEARLAEAARPRPERILLLSMPRLLGYAFNPLSVFFCLDADDRLESVIYEVKNTFGDQIPYVLAAEPGGDGAARHRQAKEMFVSPFIGMDQTYSFTIRRPDARLAVRIRQDGPEGPWLIATQNGKRRALTDWGLARLSFSHPAAAFQVIVAIHWQALKLWVKGARFTRYPGEEGAFRTPPADKPPPSRAET